MEKLRNGKFNHQIATAEEVAKAIEEIESYIEKYEWQDKKVSPYGVRIPITEFIESFKDYREYTSSSKSVMVSELNGLIEHCINPWLEIEAEPKVTIKLTNGKIKTVAKSIAESYFEISFAEAI